MNGEPVAVVGIPLMVMVLPLKEAVTPAGRPVGVPMPVAPVVVNVMGAGSAVFTQSVGEDDAALTVLTGFTVIVPVALTLPHPPVRGME